ncbi:hypothetical protein NMY22_g16856 [Coprinellus aureogranulatus]|nr:hypothetical protein NMY22_g16856 [Coprinellus aureogranulatus]
MEGSRGKADKRAKSLSQDRSHHAEANSLLFNLMQFRLLVSSGMNGDSDWEGREEGIKRKGQRPSGRMEPRGAEDAVGEKILITETSGETQPSQPASSPWPKSLPLVGNLFQLPQKEPWVEYDRLCKQYGDILYLEAMGQPILMLGSLERANDMLEKRAANYSDRPVLPALELMQVGWSFSLMQYGADWRTHRRSFHKLLSPSALPKYKAIFDDEVPAFLRKLHRNPEAFLDHTRDLFGYAIMRVTYGFDDPLVNKSLLHDGETLLQAFAEATLPGRYLVNDIPLLKHIPEWLPGAGFRRHFNEMARISRRVLVDAFERAWNDNKSGRRTGHASMVDSLIEDLPAAEGPEREEALRIARNVCAVTYSAGADTGLGCHRRDLLSRTLGSGLQFLMLCVAWNEWTRARILVLRPPISFPLNPRSRLAWLSRHLISRCARSILGPVPGHCPMVDLAECCARDCHSLRQSPFEAPDRSRRVLPSIDINLELSAHSRSYLGAILTLAIEPD